MAIAIGRATGCGTDTRCGSASGNNAMPRPVCKNARNGSHDSALSSLQQLTGHQMPLLIAYHPPLSTTNCRPPIAAFHFSGLNKLALRRNNFQVGLMFNCPPECFRPRRNDASQHWLPDRR